MNSANEQTIGLPGEDRLLIDRSVLVAMTFPSASLTFEQFVDATKKASTTERIILATDEDGNMAPFPLTRNRHLDGILRTSTVPAGPQIEKLAEEAVASAKAIAEALDHIGVLTVEFFASSTGPLVNEIAPRVHNSGHWTIEGAQTSQFEQHLRAILGLPLGDSGLVAGGAIMDNLIGNDVDRWAEFVTKPGRHLHLYGKGEARPGRKMGHVTRLT